MIQDQGVQMVRYMHPNRGQHPVYGVASKKFYGMRAGGGTETFLVLQEDVAAMPHYFHLVAPIPEPPKTVIVPPPAPTRLVPQAEPFAPVDGGPPPPVMMKEVAIDAPEVPRLPFVNAVDEDALPEGSVVREDGVIEIPQNPDPMQRALDGARFDLQLLPGASENIVRAMADANLNSVEKILEGGVEKLRNVKGLGPVRAAIIYGYVLDNFGSSI